MVPPRCSCPFLPEEHRPYIRSETFGTPRYSCIAVSAGHVFRGCSHSITFRLPCLLGPQAAPTASPICDGRPGRLRHASLGWLPAPSCGIATCLNRAIDMTGLSPVGLQPCRLLPDPYMRHYRIRLLPQVITTRQANNSSPLVPTQAYCAYLPGSVSGVCLAQAGSPWPASFPPPPPLLALCLAASSVL